MGVYSLYIPNRKIMCLKHEFGIKMKLILLTNIFKNLESTVCKEVKKLILLFPPIDGAPVEKVQRQRALNGKHSTLQFEAGSLVYRLNWRSQTVTKGSMI